MVPWLARLRIQYPGMTRRETIEKTALAKNALARLLHVPER